MKRKYYAEYSCDNCCSNNVKLWTYDSSANNYEEKYFCYLCLKILGFLHRRNVTLQFHKINFQIYDPNENISSYKARKAVILYEYLMGNESLVFLERSDQKIITFWEIFYPLIPYNLFYKNGKLYFKTKYFYSSDKAYKIWKNLPLTGNNV